jgi:CdiI immunity protein
MLGAYLDQDWPLDYETAEDALTDTVADAWHERLTRAAAELRAHRPPRDNEEATRRFLNDLCGYHLPGDGLTYVAWLDHVQAVLDDAANA